GKAVKPIMYGLFGISSYFIALLISAIGGALTVMDGKRLNKGKIVVIFVFVFCFMGLLHIAAIRLFDTSSFISFVKSGYDVGQEIKGQGAFNAIITYPVWKLVGTVGSIIFYACVILLMLVLFTNMSIKRVGEGVKEKLDDTKESMEKFREEREQRKLERAEEREERRRKKAELHTEPLPNDNQNSDERKELKMEGFINGEEGYLRRNRENKLTVVNFKENKEEGVAENVTQEPYEEHTESRLSPAKRRKYFEEEPQSGSIFSAPLGDGSGKTTLATTPGVKSISINDKTKYKPASKPAVGGFLHLLKEPDNNFESTNQKELERKSEILEETFESFNVNAMVMNITSGPTITRYEVLPAHGVKINKILSLQDDIKMALAAKDIRIEAPIPGKNAVGIEIPNDSVRTVYLREVLESNSFKVSRSKLTFALGIDIDGNSVVADLKKMPHLLIAGATGSGKSVCVNNIILSFLYNATPEEVKMIMIDPKMVEMTAYNNLPHMLIPVVTDNNKAAGALRWALNEMEMRYNLFSKAGVKELSTYNANVENEEDKKPAIVVFVDELADLMLVAKAEVEDIINRIAAKGRAAGIHLVLATQRPSVNVITGVIKANIPSRIALHVVSQIDSRTILDSAGAEKLLGNGDMLFNPNGAGAPERLQGAYVSEEEIKEITDFIRETAEAEYNEDIINEIEKNTNAVMGLGVSEDAEYDELLPEA
ncbi:MAG: DNA translocase FtsK, partial [Clostridia bacterium]|nr:DNA translocase FtsK [Clostridia bacterium]